jgi:hypothetical protein
VDSVKLANDTITVFNARVDPETGGNVWRPTIIKGVSWYATDAATVDASKGGLVAANKATIRIPVNADAGGRQYTDPVNYANVEDVSGIWTLKNGDIIVKGAVTGPPWTTDEGKNVTTNLGVVILLSGDWRTTPAKLKALFDCVTVLAVTDNRRAPNAPHWRVTAT